MPRDHVQNGLELDRDESYHRRERRVQRVGWGIVAVTLVIGQAGVLGQGPMALDELRGAGFEVRYERLARHDAPTRFEIRAGPGLAGSGEVAVSIDREWLQGADLESVTPAPVRTVLGDTTVVFIFAVSDRARGAEILFDFRPDAKWRRRGTIAVGDGPAVAFTQIVFP